MDHFLTRRDLLIEAEAEVLLEARNRLNNDLRMSVVDNVEIFNLPSAQEFENEIAKALSVERRVELVQLMQFERICQDFSSIDQPLLFSILDIDGQKRSEIKMFCRKHSDDMRAFRESEEMKIVHNIVSNMPDDDRAIFTQFYRGLFGF